MHEKREREKEARRRCGKSFYFTRTSNLYELIATVGFSVSFNDVCLATTDRSKTERERERERKIECREQRGLRIK